jgi:hypothetical protein
MNTAKDMLDEGMRALEDVFGNQTIIYRGRHIPCTLSPLRNDNDLEPGGKRENLWCTATILKSSHPTRTADANEGWTADADDIPTADEDLMPPHKGKRCMAYGRYMRIGEILSETAVAWTVRIESSNR